VTERSCHEGRVVTRSVVVIAAELSRGVWL